MQNGVDLSSRETVDQGVEAVLRKYRHLYSLGVRGFALFVDDIDLQEAFEGSEMQAYMVDRIQTALDQAYNTPDKAPPVSYTHLDVYKRQGYTVGAQRHAQCRLYFPRGGFKAGALLRIFPY